MTYNSKKVPVVHKRVWNVNMWSKCCWTPERHEYYDGKMRAFNSKFHLTKEAWCATGSYCPVALLFRLGEMP
eukprot:SAG11_NODE_141_length_14934_cov_4.821503_3_plen_72_part_00